MRVLPRLMPISAALMLSATAAKADSMTTWNGASASVQVFDQSQAQSGATATAAVTSGQVVPYSPITGQNRGQIYQVEIGGSANASATGQSNGLLQLGSTYNAPDTGGDDPTLTPWGTAQHLVVASASWNGDRAQVSAGAGSILPSTIRLNFSVSFEGFPEPPGPQPGTINNLTITANGLSSSVNGRNYSQGGNFTVDPSSTLKLDSFAWTGQNAPWYSSAYSGYQGTFHVDLPLNASGLSDPFSVGLSSTIPAGLEENDWYQSWFKDLSLSLTDITLPDGTPLSSLGDSVSFASGMTYNTPEPSTMLIVSAGLAGVAIGRRRAGRGAHSGVGDRGSK